MEVYGVGLNIPVAGEFSSTTMAITSLNGVRAKAVQGHDQGIITVLSVDSKLYMGGTSMYGHFGNGDAPVNERGKPRELDIHVQESFDADNIPVVGVACSAFHSMALSDDGQVYSWGSNAVFNSGDDMKDGVLLGYSTSRKTIQCGFSSPEKMLWTSPAPQLLPKLVSAFHGKVVRQLACGVGHCVALLQGCDVFSWGNGGMGKLGHGDELSQILPVKITALDGKNVCVIEAGGNFSAAVTVSGTLYTWGDNSRGQLACSDKRCVLVPTLVKTIVNNKGETMSVRQVAAGHAHCLALTVDGTVYCWGANDTYRSRACTGRLGLGTILLQPKPTVLTFPGLAEAGHGIVQVCAGHSHSAALSENGHVWFWGVLRPPTVRDDEHYFPSGYIAYPQRLVAGLEDRSVVQISSGNDTLLFLVDRPTSDVLDYQLALNDAVYATGTELPSLNTAVVNRLTTNSFYPGSTPRELKQYDSDAEECAALRLTNAALLMEVTRLRSEVTKANAWMSRFSPLARLHINPPINGGLPALDVTTILSPESKPRTVSFSSSPPTRSVDSLPVSVTLTPTRSRSATVTPF